MRSLSLGLPGAPNNEVGRLTLDPVLTIVVPVGQTTRAERSSSTSSG